VDGVNYDLINKTKYKSSVTVETRFYFDVLKFYTKRDKGNGLSWYPIDTINYTTHIAEGFDNNGDHYISFLPDE